MQDYQPHGPNHVASPPREKAAGRDASNRNSSSAWSSLALQSSGRSSSTPTMQRKAVVSAPNDPMELEADTVAAKVMAMGDVGSIGAGSAEIQRKCAACEEEEKIYPKHAAEGAADRSEGAMEAVSEASRGGAPLSSDLRAFFEPRFERDFSRVRIHTDGNAAAAAQAVQARAYTYGRDIVFAPGEFSPNSMDGRQLLAHELTHVVQQQSDSPPRAHGPSVGSTSTQIARDVGWAQRGPIADPYGMGYNDIYKSAGAASLSAVQDLSSCEGSGMTFNRSAFEALSTARRTAVLRLRPHAAGTACEAWFTTLANATSGGAFTIDTYRPHQSAAGDVDKMVGAEIKFTFTPSINTLSDKIGFVQVLKPIELFENEKPRATQAADGEAGWALDRAEDRRSPIYGQNNSGDAGSNTHFGHRTSATDMDPAWIYDKTNEPRNQGQALAFQGTTFALDATHSTYLGGVHWGFNVSAAGAITTTPIKLQSLAGPEGIQRRALELWNAQANNTDASKRNHPNQDQVPVP